MKSETRRKLEEVFSYPFFQHVGRELPNNVVGVPNWSAAIKECSKPKWEACRLMARNTLQRLVEERCWDRVQDWDPLTDELRPSIVEFVDTMLGRTSLTENVSSKIRHEVSWDIMFICVEFDYQDVVSPLFHIRFLDSWYASGHFPCGWSGDAFPDRWDGTIHGGKLIVF